MIAPNHSFNFRPKKKGVHTLPPRARIRHLTFVEAATDLSVPAEIFDAVLARLGYHYRRYQTGRCTDSIRLRLFNLAYRIDKHCNKGSRSAAACSYTQSVFERNKLGLSNYSSALHGLPRDDRNVRIIDTYIASTLLNNPEFGFTLEIIEEALARSVPIRIAPPREIRRAWFYQKREGRT